MIKPLKGWKKVYDKTSRGGDERKRVYGTHESRWDGVSIDFRETAYSKMDPKYKDEFYVGVSGVSIGAPSKDFHNKKDAEKHVTNIMKYVNTGRELNVLDF